MKITFMTIEILRAARRNKSSKAKKNNKQKKKSKENVANNNGEASEKLYEINDIDLLCSIIQNTNESKTKGKTQGKKN